MLVTWRYRERDTIIQRFDPRTRIIFMLCAMFSIIQFWDLRFVLIITILSLATALTGRGGINIYTETHPFPLWQGELHLFGSLYTLKVTVERFTFLVTQIIRFFSFAALAVPIPFTIHPARYGIAFRRLGLPDKFAFATDLAFRFVPSLGQDFQMTLDAQRARGYDGPANSQYGSVADPAHCRFHHPQRGNHRRHGLTGFWHATPNLA
jgi:energy-coupling factor transport system permease protein